MNTTQLASKYGWSETDYANYVISLIRNHRQNKIYLRMQLALNFLCSLQQQALLISSTKNSASAYFSSLTSRIFNVVSSNRI